MPTNAESTSANQGSVAEPGTGRLEHLHHGMARTPRTAYLRGVPEMMARTEPAPKRSFAAVGPTAAS